MKKRRFIIIGLLLIIILSGSYVVVSNICFYALKGDVNTQAAIVLTENQCTRCHTDNAEAPFYASFPGIGTLVKNDMTLGYRNYDLGPVLTAIKQGDPINQTDINKIWRSVETGRMPLHQYRMLHWQSNIAVKEKKVLYAWATTTLSDCRYATESCRALKSEPIKPIPLTGEQVDSVKVALGDRMFHDPRLSIDNTISCASCHGLNIAGIDNKVFSDGVNGQIGNINAPTVYNAVFNHLQFWDGRAADLDEQAAGPPENPVEMGAHTWDDIVKKLRLDVALSDDFEKVYGEEGITKASVTNAIAEFEKTLTTPNARFDQYLRGDTMAINAQEHKGYQLFKQYDCHTCHAGVNIGGLSFELIGLHNDYLADRGNHTDADFGRFSFTGIQRDKYRLKTPTLRNIALTAPYFHDGTIKSLDEAVEKMVWYQTRHDGLQQEEQEAIVAFLHTLTGEYKGVLLTNTGIN